MVRPLSSLAKFSFVISSIGLLLEARRVVKKSRFRNVERISNVKAEVRRKYDSGLLPNEVSKSAGAVHRPNRPSGTDVSRIATELIKALRTHFLGGGRGDPRRTDGY